MPGTADVPSGIRRGTAATGSNLSGPAGSSRVAKRLPYIDLFTWSVAEPTRLNGSDSLAT